MSEGDGSVGKDRVFHDVIDVTDGEGGGDVYIFFCHVYIFLATV